ncbi:drug/metabolite transporter (DMT)-like permease [Pedobacter africanus]|uniref:Drug/metabolite transporter (DMT)-like permease n=1 Tax=Pedobacter africanus TaxID=151894 RepID=A0ACC6L2U6_9SPHI|nr:EamA family transporter [Pedobacter africanus]MDR6785735.1 drug/metabolite transporter (DMT)-like permease [Pedobacter africanus]
MPSQLNKKASPLMVIIAFAVVYIVWGSTYFFIQKALAGFPPFILGAFRFLAAGILLLGWCILKGEKVIDKKSIKQAAIAGVLMLGVGNGLVIWVEQSIPSGLVAILVSSAAMWFVVLDKPKWGENLRSKSTIMGLIVGFIGVILLFAEQLSHTLSNNQGSTQIIGIVLLLLAPIGWAAGSLYSKYNSTDTVSVSVTTSWQMLAAGLAFIPGIFLNSESKTFNWQNVSTDAWLSVAYLVIFGSIAAFSAYVWLLSVRPATQVSTYAYVNPVVAVLLSVLFTSERVTFIQIIGLVVILASVLLINLAKYRATRNN